MKSIFINIFLYIGIIYTTYAQNFIIAGQTSGQNIYYTDYQQDNVAIYPESKEFRLDVDNNGNNDLLFSIHYHNNCNEYITWWTSVKALTANIKIIQCDYPESGYVKRLNEGDTISNSQSWNSDSVTSLIFEYYFKVNSTGQQIHKGTFYDGFLGYKIINSIDTSYGWIKIHCSYETITAMENSILEKSNGLNEYYNSDNHFQIYPNPCFDRIVLTEESPGYVTNRQYEVINIYGKKMISGQFTTKDTGIYIIGLEPGLYIIKVIEGNKTLGALKLIKLD
jgi:hypothetical protein